MVSPLVATAGKKFCILSGRACMFGLVFGNIVAKGCNEIGFGYL